MKKDKVLGINPRTDRLLLALKTFRNCGQIEDILLEGFTQHGNWIGIQNSKELGWDSTRLRATILPKERRTKTDDSGHVHLLTSYRNLDLSSKQINLDYKTVAGAIIAPNCKVFKAVSLTHAGAIELEKVTQAKLPLLEKVDNSIFLPNIKELNAPNLTTIDGVLNVYRATAVNIPKLKNVKGLSFESLDLKNKRSIFRNLSNQSLLLIKTSTHTPPSLNIINTEINKRLLVKNLQHTDNSRDQTLHLS